MSFPCALCDLGGEPSRRIAGLGGIAVVLLLSALAARAAASDLDLPGPPPDDAELPSPMEKLAATTEPEEGLTGDPQSYVHKAEQAEAEGHFREAAADYARAFALDSERPSRVQWAIRSGDLLRAIGQEAQAAAAYHRALRIDPDFAPAQQRLVELALFQAELFGRPMLPKVAELAGELIRMAPDNPAGYRARAIANQGIGTAEGLAEALADCARLRQLAPDEPAGYFYAALILSARPRQPTTAPVSTQPAAVHDPAEAERLIAFTPPDAPPPVRSRFRLYQMLYGVRGGGTLEAAIENARSRLADITDHSRMSRGEQVRLAWLIERIAALSGRPAATATAPAPDAAAHYRQRAENIYLAWGNDLAAQLAELSNPPVRPQLLEALRTRQPRSLAADAKLAEFYLNTGQEAKADAIIAAGLELPVLDAGLIGKVQSAQRYALFVARAKLLLLTAGRKADLKARSDGYQRAGEFLQSMSTEFPNVTQKHPEWHRLTGLAAMNRGQYGQARQSLETAWDLLAKMDPVRTAVERLTTALPLVELYRGTGRTQAAYDLLMDPSLAPFRSNPRIMALHGALALDLAKYQEALDIADRLVNHDPALARRLKDEALKRMDATDGRGASSRPHAPD